MRSRHVVASLVLALGGGGVGVALWNAQDLADRPTDPFGASAETAPKTAQGIVTERELEELRAETEALRRENQDLQARLKRAETALRASDPHSAPSGEQLERLKAAQAWIEATTKREHTLEDLIAVKKLVLAGSVFPDSVDVGLHLASFPALETLNLAGVSLTGRHLRALPARIRTLYAHGVDVRDGAGVESILHLKDSLRSLLLPTPWGAPEQLKILADEFTQLSHLSCLHAANVTDEGLAHIVRLPALRELRIANCQGITRAGLKTLAGLPLRWLDVNGCLQLTDADLETIAELPQLVSLEMHGVPIEGPGLVHLRRLTALKSLFLSRSKVDGCALALAEIPSLQYVDVRDTPLAQNAAELAALQTARPGLRVVSKR